MLIRALSAHRPLGQLLPAHAHAPVGFQLGLRPDASGCQLLSLYQPRVVENSSTKRQSSQPSLVAPVMMVPNLARTNNPQPFLACDTAAFVLGWAGPDKAADVSAAKNQAFAAQMGLYAQECGDEQATVYVRWVANGKPGLDEAINQLDVFGRQRLAMDRVCIVVQGQAQRIHEKLSAQQWWVKKGLEGKTSRRETICLSCGQWGPVVDTLPQSLTGALIPATQTSTVALASVNFTSASRGAKGKGLTSAPICATCATTAVQAFNDLAQRGGSHRWESSGADQATIWWTRSGETSIGVTLGSAQPEAVRTFLAQTVRPGPQVGLNLQQQDRFYALTFSGNVARLVVRDWLDMPLAQAVAHVRDWFLTTEVPGRRPFHGIGALALACATVVRKDGRWQAQAVHGCVEALFRTALAGVKPPRNLLALVVHRAQAEARYLSSDDELTRNLMRARADARLGLIRVCLALHTPKENHVSAHLDEESTDPAYVFGRLFAVREALQYQSAVASSSEQKKSGLSATIVDRYCERASAHPASVEHSLDTLSQQHLRTLTRKGKHGTVILFSKKIQQIYALAENAPGRLSVEQQARWIAGYWHQRHHDFEQASQLKQERALKTAQHHSESADLPDLSAMPLDGPDEPSYLD